MTPEEYYHTQKYEFKHTFNLLIKPIVIYEFGVWCGASIINLLEQLVACHIPIKKYYGIDTFEGLPQSEQEGSSSWIKGAFSASELLEKSPEDAKNFIYNLIKNKFPHIDLDLIRSKFNELPINNKWLPADYVHVDCDLYSSTLDVWSFLKTNNIIKIGTIINYNDFPWDNEFSIGEGKAHIEFIESHNIKCDRFGHNIFKITQIN